MSNPEILHINAWTGEEKANDGRVGKHATYWARQDFVKHNLHLAADEPTNLRHWYNADVGWGLLLPERENLTPAQMAKPEDAPAPIKKLYNQRSEKMGKEAPVFRYNKDLDHTRLLRYFPNGQKRFLEFSQSRPGIHADAVPRYLLIYGTPEEIPWHYQYALNGSVFVGRLDLEGENPGDALHNYVSGLLSDEDSSESRREAPLIWAVNNGPDDITELMRGVISEPLMEKFSRDSETSPHVTFITDERATTDELISALSSHKPAFIVTSSHGKTGPLSDLNAMRKQLGLLVDVHYDVLDPGKLLESWQPNGAIWYAHACCSAGSDGRTSYKGLVEKGTRVYNVLNTVSQLGAQVAPLPRALLGAPKPLKAFIGHVEPTFNWTLHSDQTGQVFTHGLISALYNHLYQADPETVGMAFDNYYDVSAHLHKNWSLDRDNYEVANDPQKKAKLAANMMRTKLRAIDRYSMVILGDPVVALPPVGG